MRNRWLVVIVIASLGLNVAVVGAYFFRRAHHGSRRFAGRGLTTEVREKMRQAREAAMPQFAEMVRKVEATDSLLWAEMRRDSPDSVRVESLCRELGQMHGRMRADVFRQMHRELQLMPAGARAEYLQHMMRMRPGRGPGMRMGRGPGRFPPPEGEPLPGEPPPETGD